MTKDLTMHQVCQFKLLLVQNANTTSYILKRNLVQALSLNTTLGTSFWTTASNLSDNN